jgi:predicted ATPase
LLLRSVEIKNFRSLERVELAGLSKTNVFIGRNNAGKSAVFSALRFLAETVFRRSGGVMIDAGTELLTRHDPARRLEIDLTFVPSEQDRFAFIDLLIRSRYPAERRKELIQSGLVREVTHRFRSSPGDPGTLLLFEIETRTEDQERVTVAQSPGDVVGPSASINVVDIPFRIETRSGAPFDRLMLQFAGDGIISNTIDLTVTRTMPSSSLTETMAWFVQPLRQFFHNAYFLDPYRHSQERLSAQPRNRMSPDGSDLAVVLNELSGNDREKFEAIEKFMHDAVPDLGRLHAGMVGPDRGGGMPYPIEVFFRTPSGDRIKLSDTGGGIEQLAMIAVVLHTTDQQSPLFLEEPETHLHPGAQRYLLEQLCESERQTFLTTHSPVFINTRRERTVFLLRLAGLSTRVHHYKDREGFGSLLEEIGARNSDVLLNEAVVFVEGPSDRDVLLDWSRRLGADLSDHYITVIPMGGGRYADRQAAARLETLERISMGMPIPCLFVVDRDEQSADQVSNLKRRFGDSIHVLQCREIENYLLDPDAILAALSEKYRDDAPVLERLSTASASEIEGAIDEAASGLFGTILVKRIRAQVGLKDGLLPDFVTQQLVEQVGATDLAEVVAVAISEQVRAHLASLDLAARVATIEADLQVMWQHRSERLRLAPGEELLASVFKRFGAEYTKRTDCLRIARKLRTEFIPTEFRELVARAHGLGSRRGGATSNPSDETS